jgi:Sugar (and other) transporter
MGLSTLAIGLTPTYETIGGLAPVLLVIFRLLQGISFGAEFGTASTWVVEQAARSKYRAFWGAWVGFAIPIGLLLGFGSVILVKSLMSPADFNAWGWRIFFVIGFLVAIVGLIIRTRTMDSFVFGGAGCNSQESGESGLARHAVDHPEHVAGERHVQRRVLPLFRVRHRLYEGGRVRRGRARRDRSHRRGLHADLYDHRRGIGRLYQSPRERSSWRRHRCRKPSQTAWSAPSSSSGSATFSG